MSRMITAETIRGLIESDLSEKGFFVVDILVKPSKKIMVFADTFTGITLEDCVFVSRLIESKTGSDLEEYELEVSSPGLDNPLKLPVQYKKNKGNLIRVVNTDSETLEGKIKEADDKKFVLETLMKRRKGVKKAVNQSQCIEIEYTTVKTAKLVIR
jgi:ribosome maturation factor RimP